MYYRSLTNFGKLSINVLVFRWSEANQEFSLELYSRRDSAIEGSWMRLRTVVTAGGEEEVTRVRHRAMIDAVKSAKPVTMWYQSGTSIRRNTRHTNVGDLAGMIGATGELDCFSAHIRLREPSKSEDKVDPVGLSYPKVKHRLERRWTRRSTTVPQRRIYRLQRKGCRCKSTNSRAMGLTASWYRRDETSVELSIPCSPGGRALVVKGAEEVENAFTGRKGRGQGTL
ncbi:hypothetical protein BHE74_00008001 [Ensete ventricosum]|nr:hypothetical protein BHE74_00008001 [Ensete ventricosum]